MTTQIRPRPGILDIAPYRGGRSAVHGLADVLKLSSNENPLGASPAVAEAWARAGRDLHRYPDGSHAALREAIGEVHGLDPARVVCGAGSDEILALLAQSYAGPGDEVIHPEHGFAMYPIMAHAAGARPVAAPERERVVDVDAILARAGERTRVVFLANPANPTGTMLGADALRRLADGLPPQVLLVLDGAYAEYAEGYDGGAALIDEGRGNVMMTRTFSKIHGLGGLRVGWGYGPAAVADVLNRVRMPFNLGRPQLLAAEAAVRDRAWVSRCRAENAQQRRWLAAALRDLGLGCDEPEANFVLARLASADEARACDAHLAAEGILVRAVAGYGLPECLRITVGDEAACRRVVRSVAAFLQAEPRAGGAAHAGAEPYAGAERRDRAGPGDRGALSGAGR